MGRESKDHVDSVTQTQQISDTSFRQSPCLQESIILPFKKQNKTISLQVLGNLAAKAWIGMKTSPVIMSGGWMGAEGSLCGEANVIQQSTLSAQRCFSSVGQWGHDQTSGVGWIRAGGQGQVDRWESPCGQSIQHLQGSPSSHSLCFNGFLQAPIHHQKTTLKSVKETIFTPTVSQ